MVACFKKKETVRGIIGKTQGVSKANNPPIKPKKKMFQLDFEVSFFISVPKNSVLFKSRFKALDNSLLLESVVKELATSFPSKENTKVSVHPSILP